MPPSEHRALWLIDPLSCTKEFLARNRDFTVNIALIEQGRSIVGVVHAPAIDSLYWADRGLGARRARAGLEEAIYIQPGSGPCRVVARKSHFNAETETFIDQLGVVELAQTGSSLKFCRVAEDTIDIYPRRHPLTKEHSRHAGRAGRHWQLRTDEG